MGHYEAPPKIGPSTSDMTQILCMLSHRPWQRMISSPLLGIIQLTSLVQEEAMVFCCKCSDFQSAGYEYATKGSEWMTEKVLPEGKGQAIGRVL